MFFLNISMREYLIQPTAEFSDHLHGKFHPATRAEISIPCSER